MKVIYWIVSDTPLEGKYQGAQLIKEEGFLPHPGTVIVIGPESIPFPIDIVSYDPVKDEGEVHLSMLTYIDPNTGQLNSNTKYRFQVDIEEWMRYGWIPLTLDDLQSIRKKTH